MVTTAAIARVPLVSATPHAAVSSVCHTNVFSSLPVVACQMKYHSPVLQAVNGTAPSTDVFTVGAQPMVIGVLPARFADKPTYC